MAVSIKDFRMAIRIDNSEAKAKFDETKRQLADVAAQMKKLEEEGSKNSKSYKELKKQHDALNTSLYRQRLEAGRTALTYNELRQGASQLRRAMNSVKPGTAEWKQLREELRLTQQRMKELSGTATETGLSLGKLADGFNRYAAIGASALATLTGMTLTMRKCVDEYAQMEEAESQVIKYTGMTAEEVKQLNEEFKAMDTRTPREELNRLAGEAGKLGITGVQEVREFVEAANQINVALGEDLGEEAVNQIGKLSQMFGDESRSLKDNMLAIGSAVNQVAQSTSASEPYLVQFTARMGGVGKQAKMSVTDIMGFASALDQNMLRSEMASTALSGLIMRIYQEPAKYAKLAGMDVEQFTQLVETDVNEAVMSFLSALNKMGGMAQMAPVLKEMQLSGAEAASVISTLAGNVDLVRKEQENANKAFTEGTSITNEYAVQNNTVQARLEKLQNDFKNVRVELGERLLPVMRYMISTGSLTVKGIKAVASVFTEYKATIITVTSLLLAYVAAQKAEVAWSKIVELWNGRVVTSFNRLWAAIRNNPWALMASLAATFIAYMRDMNPVLSEAEQRQRMLNQVMGEAETSIRAEQQNMQILLKTARDKTLSDNERLKAIQALNSISPEYLGNLNMENINTSTADAAIKRYTASILANAKAKSINAKLDELAKQREDLQQNPQQLSKWYDPLTTGLAKMGSDMERVGNAMQTLFMKGDLSGWNEQTDMERNYATNSLDAWGERYTAKMKQFIEDEKALKEELEKVVKETVSISPPSSLQGTTSEPDSSRLSGSEADDSQYKTQLAQMEQQYREQQNLLKKSYIDQQLTQEEYGQQSYALESAHLEARKALMEQFGQGTTGIQGQIYDRLIAEANKRHAEQLAQQKAEQDAQKKAEEDAAKRKMKQDDADRTEGFRQIKSATDIDQQLSILQAMYDRDLINYEQYEQMKDELAEEHEQRRSELRQRAVAMIGQAAGAASQLFSALQQRETSQIEARYDKQIKEARKAGKDTTKLEEEKEAALNAVKKKYADKQFAMTVLQITADTAAAIMRSFSDLGPILGSVYAAIVAAQGAAQIAVAKQQRDEAKGLKSGGYSRDYIEGYTTRGNPNDTAGVIPVHKNEFVANHEAVANPDVKQFLDVFDVAQKRGTIRMLNTTQILEQIRTRGGRYSGGYTAENAGASRSSASPLPGFTAEQRSQVVLLLEENNRLLTVLAQKELVVDPRKVRDSINHINQLEKNVSR